MSSTMFFVIGMLLILGGIAAKSHLAGIEWVFGLAGLYCWYKALTEL